VGTPEGHYLIDGRNASKPFHTLAAHLLSAPADVTRAKKYGSSPGDAIFIHGTPQGRPLCRTTWTMAASRCEHENR